MSMLLLLLLLMMLLLRVRVSRFAPAASLPERQPAVASLKMRAAAEFFNLRRPSVFIPAISFKCQS